MRLSLRRAGSPTWPPSEDLSWCGWIDREGDEYARELAAEIEIALAAREGDLENDGGEGIAEGSVAERQTDGDRAPEQRNSVILVRLSSVLGPLRRPFRLASGRDWASDDSKSEL